LNLFDDDSLTAFSRFHAFHSPDSSATLPL
jgi:hypothetical protein